MERGDGVAKNEDEVMVTVTPSNAEVPTSDSSSSHEDKKNHNLTMKNVIKKGAKIVISCIYVCLLLILLIVILPVAWIFNVKKNGASSVIRCMFVCLVGILIASLTKPKLKDTLIWGLELWKWTIFVLVILCGRLISNWLIQIPRNLFKAMKLRVVSLDLVHEMKESVRPFIWLGLILLVWVLLINPGVERSKDTTKILDHVTDALVGCLVVAAIWFAKSLLIRLLAYSFQHGRFSDRIKKISFKLYVVKILLNDSSLKEKSWKSFFSTLQNDLKEKIKEKRKKKDLNDDQRKKKDLNEDPFSLFRKEREKMFAKIREGHMYEKIRSWISDILEKKDGVQKDMENTSNSNVVKKAADDAHKIFTEVLNLDSEYICKEDLQPYLEEEVVDRLLLQLYPQARETNKIEKSSLKEWMVKSYEEFEALAHSLDQTRETLGKLDRPASGIAIVTGIIVWCFMMGIFTTKVLVVISSQILAASFVFGNTVKTVFEAIIFVFFMHPFDVGDQCVIGEEQMRVEEIRIMCTIFYRKDDTEKIFYPNSVLLNEPIRNTSRNLETETETETKTDDDSVEFNIDHSISAEAIDFLRKEIKIYLERNPQDWLPNHSVEVKDIDNSGNLKMSLCVSYNRNTQSSRKKSSRRSDLILQLRKILEQLEMKYRLLPSASLATQ